MLSVLLPEISKDNQEGTIHFHYLLNVGGGLLEVARSLEEHVAQLVGDAGRSAPRRRTGAPVYRGVHPAARADRGRRRRGSRRRSKPSAQRPAPRAAGAPPAAWVARVLLLPWLAFAQLRTATQPFRKETRYKYRRFRRHCEETGVPEDPARSPSARLKQIVGEEPPQLRQESGAILTPKLNKHRDPAKSLAVPRRAGGRARPRK